MRMYRGAAAVFVLVFGLAYGQDADRPITKLPYTPSLDPAAMDKSVDPCVDFFHYACGGWIRNNPIPPDQARWDVYAKLETENERLLWGILRDSAEARAGRTQLVQQIGDYFAACMDEDAVEKAGAAPLKPALDEIAAMKSIQELPALLAHEQATLQAGF